VLRAHGFDGFIDQSTFEAGLGDALPGLGRHLLQFLACLLTGGQQERS
jgi:hypothetical protein